MGLLSSVLGDASQVDPRVVRSTVGPLLLPGETIDLAYKIVRDTFVCTDRRSILVDVQGVTGKKVSYRSVPYTSIVDFALDTAGTFDTDTELDLHLSGGLPVSKEFKKGTDIISVQQAIALAVRGSGACSRRWRIEGIDGKCNPSLGSFDAGLRQHLKQ